MKKIKEITVKSEAETEKLAKEIADKAGSGTVIALTGDLGSGKTTFTKYFAKALGVKEMLSSPTFTVVREYDSGRLPLYHFDVYRVNDAEELFEIGFDEYIERANGVCVIEWANLVEDLLPFDAWKINIRNGKTEQERVFEIINNGENQ